MNINPLKDFVKVNVQQVLNHLNQYLITFRDSDGKELKAFQSYKELIALYDVSSNTLYISWRYWDYSKTTLKHLKAFVNEQTPFEYQNKAQFINLIKTGKVQAW